MKQANLLLSFTLTISSFIYDRNSAIAQVCHFDSYAIINGNCVNLSNSNRNYLSPQAENTINFNYDSNQNYDLAEHSCSEFNYQNEAQAFMKKYRARELDPDADGIACDYLSMSPAYGSLTKQEWEDLKQEHLKRKKSYTVGNQESLDLYEVQSINLS